MIYNRKNNEIVEEKPAFALKIIYDNIFGRIILKLLTKKWLTNLAGKYMSSNFSKRKIKKFIIKNNIDMSEYEREEYSSFNNFFIRKIKKEKRELSLDGNDLLTPADARLTVYKINQNTNLNIKNSVYTVEELIRDKNLADKYKDGYCLVYRLCVDDYHRYSFIDNGKVILNNKIDGIFHTVQPIAFKKYKVFKENSREYTVLETENFGTMIQIEIGATLVGKICNTDVKEFKRGDEKGYFCFGGSTIVILIEKDRVIIDEDILEKSAQDIETRVLLFDKIGRKLG